MSKTTVLVTSTQLSEQAQQILRDAGLEIILVPEPASEDATTAVTSRRC